MMRLNATMKKALLITERFGFTFISDSAVGKNPRACKRAFLALERRNYLEMTEEGFGPVWRLSAEGREALIDLEGA